MNAENKKLQEISGSRGDIERAAICLWYTRCKVLDVQKTKKNMKNIKFSWLSNFLKLSRIDAYLIRNIPKF